jgi:hypothetical protein
MPDETLPPAGPSDPDADAYLAVADAARRLAALLDDPQPGSVEWAVTVLECMRHIHDAYREHADAGLDAGPGGGTAGG